MTDSQDTDGNDVKPGEQCPKLGRFFTEQEAAEFIGALPDAETGRYSIDALARLGRRAHKASRLTYAA